MKGRLQLRSLKVFVHTSNKNFMTSLIAKEHLPDCTIHVKKEDLLPSDDQLLHYLIVFSFSSSNMIQVLQDIPEGKL